MLWVVWLLKLCLLSVVYVSESLRFHGRKAYAIYEKWDARTNGTLMFYFRTHKRNGLLFYMDDLGKQQFLDLSLVDGRVRVYLYFWDEECYLKKKFIHGTFADSKWHKVTVRRNFEETIVKVDNYSTTVICKIYLAAPDAPYFDVRSVLYAGAFPTDVPLNSLSNPTSYWESNNLKFSFQGCIVNVTLSDGISSFKPAKLKETKGTSKTCNSACSEPAYNKCQHRARCVDKINRVECNCLGTGYEGRYCTQEAISAFLNGSGYITYTFGTDDHFLSANQSVISVRFLTRWENGIILHTNIKTRWLVIEIVKGKVVVNLNLGSGNLRLESRYGGLNDFHWHAVELKRDMRNVTLSIDNNYTDRGVLPGDMINRGPVDSESLAYIGGTTESKSKQNFSGYLQQLYFNNYEVLNKVKQNKDKRFHIHGNILLGKLLTQISLTRTPIQHTSPLSGGSTTKASTAVSVGPSPFSCPPGVSTCNPGVSRQSGTTSHPQPTSEVFPIGRQTTGRAGSLLVPIWVVILVASLCFMALCLTAFFIVRWNKRYTGSFNPEAMSPPQSFAENRKNSETQTVVTSESFYTKV